MQQRRIGIDARRGRPLATGLFSLVLLALLASAGPAHSQSSWAVAQRDEAAIQAFVGKLAPHANNVPGAGDAAAVILYKQSFYEVEERSHKLCRNFIFQVNDPAAVGEYLSSPLVGDASDLQEKAAFHMRGETVTLFDDEAGLVMRGDGEIQRGRVSFSFPALQKGDIVGWSVVIQERGPIFVSVIPAADRYPVVYSGLRVKASGQSTYAVNCEGVEPSEFEVKIDGRENERAAGWKVSLRNLAAVEELPYGGPFAADVPVFTVNLDEVHQDFRRFGVGWAPATGWSTMALILQGLQAETLEEAGGVDVYASAVTTGKPDAAAKETAICAYVHDEIELLSGDEYRRMGTRPAKQVLKEGNATEAEKCFLMLAMMQAVGLDGQFVLVRAADQGPINQKNRSLVQFQEMAVRSGGDVPRYYAPHCADCEPGKLPARWSGGLVFSPVENLEEMAEKYSEEAMKSAVAEGTVNFYEMWEKQEAQNWHRMETLPEGDV